MTVPTREQFIEEFVLELTRCQRTFVSVHEDDQTDWTAKELGSLAHDVLEQLLTADTAPQEDRDE
ncbi:hypothetical protein HUN59_05330 [Curtobacterium sp. Csp2]|uniref:hypothetical protein n=1 Tax=Curtobacterium sp. Csp2 TaxID=2495430 RepID=UPI0015802C1C|nr:hypothetical protein [Curtobacterium sp. Csp2]QKS15719.1 hypothetical protein HUN59_05330 [Curtobacterium sp. Csp2]